MKKKKKKKTEKRTRKNFEFLHYHIKLISLIWFRSKLKTHKRLVECCFTSTETVGLLGTGAQDVHLSFHTAPEL